MDEAVRSQGSASTSMTCEAILKAEDIAASKRACLQLYLSSVLASTALGEKGDAAKAETSHREDNGTSCNTAPPAASHRLTQLLAALRSDPRGSAALQNVALLRVDEKRRSVRRKEMESVERIRLRWSRDVCARVEELSAGDVRGRRVDVSRWVGGALQGGAKVRLARRECRDENDQMVRLLLSTHSSRDATAQREETRVVFRDFGEEMCRHTDMCVQYTRRLCIHSEDGSGSE